MSHELSNVLHGIDASKEISLFEYGLLIASYAKDGYDDEYFCVYSVGDDLFSTGYIREHKLNDLINGKDWAKQEDINSFLSFTGDTKESWLKLPIAQKIHTCMMHWGYQNIMGEGYPGSAFTKEKAMSLYF